jgi:hypothetical protein
VAEEQVTSPDQRKPSNLKWARIGGVVTVVVLLSMLFGNHDGIVSGAGGAWVEDVYLILTAALIAALLIGDVVLRRRGLRQ